MRISYDRSADAAYIQLADVTHTWQAWSIPNPLGGLLPLIGGNLP